MESPWAWEPSYEPYVKELGVRGQDRRVQAMLPSSQCCDSGWAGLVLGTVGTPDLAALNLSKAPCDTALCPSARNPHRGRSEG